jgi:hypothetical protein
VRDWVLGSNGKWVTMGVPSDGSYGIPEGVIYGVPVTTANGEYTAIENLRSTTSAASAWTRRWPSSKKSARALRTCSDAIHEGGHGRLRRSEVTMTNTTAGARFRAALSEETPLQVMGAITAYAGLMAKRTGYRALYLSAAASPPIRSACPTSASARWKTC